MLVLEIESPDQPRAEREVDAFPFTIGRDPSCDLVLEHPWVSRRHVVIERKEGALTVRSEGRNPVQLGDDDLTAPRRIDAGDTLHIGEVHIRIRLRAPAASNETVSLSLSVDDLFQGGAPSRLVLLAELSGTLAGAADPALVARTAAGALASAVRARTAQVLEGPDLAPLAATGRAPSTAGKREPDLGAHARRALASREALVLDATAERGPVLLAPLGPGASGVLAATRPKSEPAFDADDAGFATVLGYLLGPAIAAARKAATAQEARERLEDARDELSKDIARRGSFGALVGGSAPMRKVAELIARVAPSNATVLVTGETGSGKELVAREIHHRSPRKAGAFFAINCAALPEALIESELFGHRRGAFSGADKDRRGIFELADGGTVFLDEIGELPAAAQAKVLRALDAKEVLPLGAPKPVAVDVRLVAATHRDLAADVKAGRFRQDLLFRLNVFPIVLPPLRERLEDVPALVAHFLANSAEARRKRIRAASPSALALLAAYNFPGNVRELAHVVERAVIMADDGHDLEVMHLPEDLAFPSARGEEEQPSGVTLREAVADFERAFILRELERDGWNRTQTARRLQVSLRAFMDKLKRYDLKGPGRS